MKVLYSKKLQSGVMFEAKIDDAGNLVMTESAPIANFREQLVQKLKDVIPGDKYDFIADLLNTALKSVIGG